MTFNSSLSLPSRKRFFRQALILQSPRLFGSLLIVLLSVTACERRAAPKQTPYGSLSCNGTPSFTDFRDGKVYPIVQIGSQCWMGANLDVDRFLNGELLFHAQNLQDWQKAEEEAIPAWCYYNNNPENARRYGRLYNLHAIRDPRGLAPEGWAIPNDRDWTRLIDFVGGDALAAFVLKSDAFWALDNENSGNGINTTGFTAMPAGSRDSAGNYRGLGQQAYFWTLSQPDTGVYYTTQMRFDSDSVFRPQAPAAMAFALRCRRI